MRIIQHDSVWISVLLNFYTNTHDIIIRSNLVTYLEMVLKFPGNNYKVVIESTRYLVECLTTAWRQSASSPGCELGTYNERVSIAVMIWREMRKQLTPLNSHATGDDVTWLSFQTSLEWFHYANSIYIHPRTLSGRRDH